jgi:hypothetical protein
LIAANLFTIAASCVPEAVAAHPPRKLVLFEGKVVAREMVAVDKPPQHHLVAAADNRYVSKSLPTTTPFSLSIATPLMRVGLAYPCSA